MTTPRAPEFPRVLLICPIRLNDQTGGGVALTGFFEGWPRDRVAQLFSQDFKQGASALPAEQFLRVGNVDLRHPLVAMASDVTRPRLRRALGAAARGVAGSPLSAASERWFRRRGEDDLLGVLDWCRRFKPDVIYYVPVQYPEAYWRLPTVLSHRLGVPLVTHFMDDWPMRVVDESREAGDTETPLRLAEALRSLFARSSVDLSICGAMSGAYRERYGKVFLPLHPGTDVEAWRPLSRRRREGPFRVVYVGKVVRTMQQKAMRQVVNAIVGLREQGVDIRFEIYGPEFLTGRYTRALLRPGCCEYRGFLPHDAFRSTLMEADLLVATLNFEAVDARFGRFSFPAKLPEYMASGTPILVYGPADWVVTEEAARGGWALVVAERSVAKLEEAITSVMDGGPRIEAMGRLAREVAFRDFDAGRSRARLWEVLRLAAGQAPGVVGTGAVQTSRAWTDSPIDSTVWPAAV